MLGDNAKAEQNFQRALALAPEDSDVRHNWGWYLCSNDRPRESIPEFEIALRNPFYKTPEIALTNAGRCSAAFGDIAGAEAYYRRALARSPDQCARDVRPRAARVSSAGRLDEARGYTRRLAQLPAPAPEALYPRHVRRAQGRRPRRRERSTSRSCATAIRTRPKRRPSRRGSANERAPRRECRDGGRAIPPGATAGALLGARARRRACRSTRWRSS